MRGDRAYAQAIANSESLAKTGVNDTLAPFGMKLSGDTPRIVNTGAIAKAGEINGADRQVPYDGGREIFGGTPFAVQLDQNGNPAQSYAAYKKLDNGGRIVVMAEGMAGLFLGSPDGVRLHEDPVKPGNTKWWGKDSQVFMEEVLAWLAAVDAIGDGPLRLEGGRSAAVSWPSLA